MGRLLPCALLTLVFVSPVSATGFPPQGAALPNGTTVVASLDEAAAALPSREVAATAPSLTTSSSAQPVGLKAVDDTANYQFISLANRSLADMSSGTTQLIGPDAVNVASAVTGIGFDFWFQGVRYTQFSVNSNGLLRLGAVAVQTGSPFQALGQAGKAIITAYGAQQRTHAGDGKVHYKVTGVPGSRVLTVEWLNMQSDGNAGGTADLTYQVALDEASNLSFVYGSMMMGATGAGLSASKSPSIGIASDSIANTIGSVTAPQNGAATYDGSSAAAATNTYVAGSINVLTSVAQGVRHGFLFLPPTPNAATNLTFSAVTQVSMTLNWTDSANEAIYAIYRSTDGTNYTFDTTLPQNSTSYAVTSLAPGTTYSWKVTALSAEGGASAALVGAQATVASANISSTAAGGPWSAQSTWVGNSVPKAGDIVTIVNGAVVQVDDSNIPVAWDLTVQAGGTLRFGLNSAIGHLNVGRSVSVAFGGSMNVTTPSSTLTHLLRIGGDLINNGSINCNNTSGPNSASLDIEFRSTTDSSLTLGAGSTTTLQNVTVNKGADRTPMLTFNPAVPFSQGFGKFFVTAGTLKIDGSAVVNAVASSNIPAAGGFWLNNPNAIILSGSGTVAGQLRMSAGTLNFPFDSLDLASGANVLVEGGAINTAGYFGVSSPSNVITYNQSGGTVTVATSGNNSTTTASFDMGTAAGSSVTMSGGTIVVQNANTAASGPRDYRHQAGGSNPPVPTGGTLQLGNASSTPAQAFKIAGVVPDLVVSSQVAGHTATLLPPGVVANAARNVTLNAGTSLDIGDSFLVLYGTSVSNAGTLKANSANAVLYFVNPSAAQGYSGPGTVTGPVPNVYIQTPSGLTIDPASPNIVAQNVSLFAGTIVNANKMTLGSGGAATSTVQIGDTSPAVVTPLAQPFTFNLGTGGQIVNYLRTTSGWTTGNEINSTRTLTSLKYDDNNAAHTLTIAGGDLTLGSTGTALTLTNGRIVTGANKLVIASTTATVSRTNGYVDGTLRRNFAAAGAKTFDVGTANGYSPVTATVTAGTGPIDVRAVQGVHPNMAAPSAALKRYWTTQFGSGITANLTFNWIDPLDIPSSAAEAAFRFYRHDSTMAELPLSGGDSINVGSAVKANVTGTTVTDWTLGTPIDLFISMGHLGTFTQGQNAQFFLIVGNIGAIPLPSGIVVTVTDTLPEGLSYVSAPGPGTGWTCGAVGQVVTCATTPANPLYVNGVASPSIQLTVAVAGDAPGSVQNTATCNCSTTVPSHNTSFDVVAVEQVPPDLTITKTHSGSFAQGQSGAQYTLSVSNQSAGLVAAGAVQTVTEQPPTGMTVTGMSGFGWTCPVGGVTCTRSDALASAQTYPPIFVTVSIAANATTPLVNTATIATSGPEANRNNNTVTDSTTIVPGFPLTVTVAGSGFGQVTGSAAIGIACPGTCSNSVASGTVVTLTATPSNGSYVFTGWLGACTGTGTCAVTMNAAKSVTAKFAPVSIGTHILDVDNNGSYDALTDGLMILRKMFGLVGTNITNNAVANNAQRTDPTAIFTYLDDVSPLLDIDGNGAVDALTDGLMVLRYLFGLPADSVIVNTIGSNATRTSASAIKAYLDSLRP